MRATGRPAAEEEVVAGTEAPLLEAEEEDEAAEEELADEDAADEEKPEEEAEL